MEQALLAIAGFIITVLISLVGWFAQHNYKRLEAQQSTDRAALLEDINALGTKLNKVEIEVAKEYVNTERLTEALRPFRESLERLEHTQRELFQKLDAKVDKK